MRHTGVLFFLCLNLLAGSSTPVPVVSLPCPPRLSSTRIFTILSYERERKVYFLCLYCLPYLLISPKDLYFCIVFCFFFPCIPGGFCCPFVRWTLGRKRIFFMTTLIINNPSEFFIPNIMQLYFIYRFLCLQLLLSMFSLLTYLAVMASITGFRSDWIGFGLYSVWV